MKRLKTAFATGLVSIILLAQPITANNLEKKTNYEIRCSRFHVGNGYYKINENDEEYNINLGAEGRGVFKSWGLKYKFSTEGYKEDEKLYPRHFRRLEKDNETGYGASGEYKVYQKKG